MSDLATPAPATAPTPAAPAAPSAPMHWTQQILAELYAAKPVAETPAESAAPVPETKPAPAPLKSSAWVDKLAKGKTKAAPEPVQAPEPAPADPRLSALELLTKAESEDQLFEAFETLGLDPAELVARIASGKPAPPEWKAEIEALKAQLAAHEAEKQAAAERATLEQAAQDLKALAAAEPDRWAGISAHPEFTELVIAEIQERQAAGKPVTAESVMDDLERDLIAEATEALELIRKIPALAAKLLQAPAPAPSAPAPLPLASAPTATASTKALSEKERDAQIEEYIRQAFNLKR